MLFSILITIAITSIVTLAIIILAFKLKKNHLLFEFNNFPNNGNRLEAAKRYLNDIQESYDAILDLSKDEYKRSIDSYKKNKEALILLKNYDILFKISEIEKIKINIIRKIFKQSNDSELSELKKIYNSCFIEIKLKILEKFKTINNIKKSNKILKEYNLTFSDILIEKLFLDIYNNLEIYFQNILKILFNAYPIYLTKTEYRIEISQIYNESESIKNIIIEEEIMSILRTLNLSDAIIKMEKIFKFKFDEKNRDQFNELFFYCKIRNHLIHTDGYVNRKLIQDLNSREIKHNLAIGKNLKSEVTEITDNFLENTSNIMYIINSAVSKEIPRMQIHSQKKIGDVV